MLTSDSYPKLSFLKKTTKKNPIKKMTVLVDLIKLILFKNCIFDEI